MRYMLHPRVKFKASRVRDAKTAKAFIDDAKNFGDRMLEWAFYARYPELKGKLYDHKIMTNFLKAHYVNQEVLDRQLRCHERQWRKLERKYFALVDELLAGHSWPQGKYVAYGTIWGMYPRFLENKTFQIPYKHKNSRYVPVIIAHEMLHFIFYDYFFVHFPMYRAKKYTEVVWRTSEVFNTVIQNSPAWMRVFRVESLGYPEHEIIERRIGKEYAAGAYGSIHQLIRVILQEVGETFSVDKSRKTRYS